MQNFAVAGSDVNLEPNPLLLFLFTFFFPSIFPPCFSNLGHFGDGVFTGQMTQPTVSKH